MDTNIFTICDYAQQANNKLTIVGTFDTLWAPDVPVMQPVCSIVASIRYSKDEVGQHNFKITLLSDSGKESNPPIKGPLEFKVAEGQKWGNAQILLLIGQLTLTTFGVYTLSLFIDDKEIKSLHFTVKKVQDSGRP